MTGLLVPRGLQYLLPTTPLDLFLAVGRLAGRAFCRLLDPMGNFPRSAIPRLLHSALCSKGVKVIMLGVLGWVGQRI